MNTTYTRMWSLLQQSTAVIVNGHLQETEPEKNGCITVDTTPDEGHILGNKMDLNCEEPVTGTFTVWLNPTEALTITPLFPVC